MQRHGRYDIDRMRRDMDAKGLQAVDIARRAGTARSSITRFLNGEHQTPHMAKRIAKALRQSLDRYVLDSSEAA